VREATAMRSPRIATKNSSLLVTIRKKHMGLVACSAAFSQILEKKSVGFSQIMD